MQAGEKRPPYSEGYPIIKLDSGPGTSFCFTPYTTAQHYVIC